MKYQANYLVLDDTSCDKDAQGMDHKKILQQELHSSTLERACELAYANLYRHAGSFMQTGSTSAAHLTSLVGDDHVPFATIADLLKGKTRKEVKPERFENELGILIMLDALEKQFYHQFGERMIWQDGIQLTTEKEHTTHRSVYICDQGHYGSTSCGNCHKSLDDKAYLGDCPSCGYAFTEETQYSY